MVALIVILFVISMVFMVIRIFSYVKNNSKDGKVPVKFGRYRRNAVTLNQILVFSASMTIFTMRVSIMSALGIELEIARPFFLASNIIVFNILFDVIIPIWILCDLQRKSFFTSTTRDSPESEGFYVRQPEIVPRGDSENQASVEVQNQRINKIIFVKSAKEKDQPRLPVLKLNDEIVTHGMTEHGKKGKSLPDVDYFSLHM